MLSDAKSKFDVLRERLLSERDNYSSACSRT